MLYIIHKIFLVIIIFKQKKTYVNNIWVFFQKNDERFEECLFEVVPPDLARLQGSGNHWHSTGNPLTQYRYSTGTANNPLPQHRLLTGTSQIIHWHSAGNHWHITGNPTVLQIPSLLVQHSLFSGTSQIIHWPGTGNH